MATQLSYDATENSYTGETKRYVVRVSEQTMQDTVGHYQGENCEDCYTAEFWIESYEDDQLQDSSIVTRK